MILPQITTLPPDLYSYKTQALGSSHWENHFPDWLLSHLDLSPHTLALSSLNNSLSCLRLLSIPFFKINIPHPRVCSSPTHCGFLHTLSNATVNPLPAEALLLSILRGVPTHSKCSETILWRNPSASILSFHRQYSSHLPFQCIPHSMDSSWHKTMVKRIGFGILLFFFL